MQAEEALIRSYLSAMAAADLDRVLACFTDDATATSPTYGEMPVRSFYERLFADTLGASVDVRAIYAATADRHRWLAHFGYRWQRRSAPELVTELIDLFEIHDDRIRKLRIVFAPPAAAEAPASG